jgi:hypothetical protein
MMLVPTKIRNWYVLKESETHYRLVPTFPAVRRESLRKECPLAYHGMIHTQAASGGGGHCIVTYRVTLKGNKGKVILATGRGDIRVLPVRYEYHLHVRK